MTHSTKFMYGYVVHTEHDETHASFYVARISGSRSLGDIVIPVYGKYRVDDPKDADYEAWGRCTLQDNTIEVRHFDTGNDVSRFLAALQAGLRVLHLLNTSDRTTVGGG